MSRTVALLLAHLVRLSSASSSFRCVFMHGSGVADTQPTGGNDTMDYWGGLEHISKYTPYCASRHFLHQNTVKRGWDDSELLKATCKMAVGEASEKTIRNTVVIAHSMGNLIFAEALRQNLCSLDMGSSKWISVEALWQGSKAVDIMKSLCSNKTESKALRWVLEKLTYCDTDTPGEVFAGYKTMSPAYPALQGLVGVANNYIHRAVCGSSAAGVISRYSAAFEAIASLVRFGGPNDGMVDVDSCKLPSRDYDSHHSAPFYLAEINHADGTCRVGDGHPDSKLPCTWLSLAVDGANTTQTVFV